MQKHGNRFGTHRVIEPVGVLPQPANKLDNNMDEIYDNEILIDVQTLNIDSASFTDIHNYAKSQAKNPDDEAEVMEEIKKEMFLNVELQGKHRNRRTGSGGMLLGTVEKIGDALKGKIDLKEGDRIATLVSLSLTPLRIDEILNIKADVDQVDIKGKAILFESGIYAKIPDDMPEKLALSALDVAGAPAQTAKLCQYGQNVVVLGAGGKSGMLCCYEAKKRVGVTGKVIGLANSPKSTQRIKDLGFCDVVESVAGMTPVQVYELVSKLTNGKMADVTINCVNVPDCEMTAVLCTRDDGVVYFFSMATSFTKAALGAEGIGADTNMIIGNGYTKGHAEFTLQELRECPALRKIFEELYA
jgi:L-erythro-3,5-diaminohexanoate dehydrogenase